MKVYKNVFNKVIELDNLFSAWDEFKKGKRSRPDVAYFEFELETHIFKINDELRDETYRHGPYEGFFISDPKRRHIHKATVRDRIIHHAVFSILNPLFENTFVANSFSCRIKKGSHKGVDVVTNMLRKESKNNSRPCYALKCDIQKFFDNIDHQILLSFLTKRIQDEKMIRLLEELIGSYKNEAEFKRERERESWRYAPQRNTNRKPYIPAFC